MSRWPDDASQAMPVSAEDWSLLSAYADGELTAAEAKALRRRLRADARLATAHEDILQVRRDLQRWDPGRGRRGGLERRRLSTAGLIVAAALGGAISVAVLQGWRAPDTPVLEPAISATTLNDAFASADPLAWHLALAGESTGERHLSPVLDAHNVPALDLSMAGLSLTTERLLVPSSERTTGTVLLRHYEGRRGCRLTHVIVPGDRFGRPRISAAQEHRWQVAGMTHVLVSQGMDEARFRAIAAKAEALTRRSPLAQDRIAARTLHAPCLA